MAREKILVVDYDLDSLSKIYLALTHRRFYAKVCNKPEEIKEHIKRFKPAAIVIGLNDYKTIMEKLRIAAVVLIEKNSAPYPLNDGDILIRKPVHADELIKAVEQLI